jgi:carbonic anhydrase
MNRTIFLFFFVLLPLTVARSSTLFAEERAVLLSGWEAFGELTRGNARFAEGKLEHPRSEAARASASSEAVPHTIILTCSDSAVSPEILFDQGVGDLFVVRTAGHYLDTAARASIEFAVQEKGVRFLVVLGSEACEVTRRAFELQGKTDKNASVDLNDLYQGLWRQAYGRAGFGEGMKLRAMVQSTVNGAVRQLVESSEIIRSAIGGGRLVVAEADFRPENGRVSFWRVGYPSIYDERLRWKQTPGPGFESGRANNKVVETGER